MSGPRPLHQRDLWLAALVWAAGATLVVRVDIAWRRDAFQVEARTAHRILSQATAQLDAVLGTLVLVAGSGPGGDGEDATARLPALYPQVIAAWRREAPQPWLAGPAAAGAAGGAGTADAALAAGTSGAPGAPVAVAAVAAVAAGPGGATAAALTAAEAESAALLPAARQRAVLAGVDGPAAVYTLVRAGTPASFALRVDARRLAATEEWPWAVGTPVQVTLRHGGERIVLQDAADSPARPFGLTDGFEFTKALASPSQPFQLHARRFAGPVQWPWAALAAWTVACALLLAGARRWQAARAERLRAAELARLARTARLNTLGELAAGIAHELNQPLTATLAGTQAAIRMLREQVQGVAGPAPAFAAAPPQAPPVPPATPTPQAQQTLELAGALQALELASAQARRAADVVARLRRLLRPDVMPAAMVAIDVAAAARRLAALLAPEVAAAGIELRLAGEAAAARADPVAVDQILHNLLSNALHALQSPQAPPPGARRITVRLAGAGARVLCAVRDNGPGVAGDAAARLFEPFFSTRAGGLGLGLPLCQTLALAMDGQVRWQAPADGGAEFVLDLPAAAGADPP